MYTKNDVMNIRGSNYELTPMDEKIFKELGYVLHQVDNPTHDLAQVVYKEHFGTILNQKLLALTLRGDIRAECWYLNEYGDKDCEDLDLTPQEEALLMLKHEEMMNGFWKTA